MLKVHTSWPSSTVMAAISADRRRSLLPPKGWRSRRSITLSTAAPACRRRSISSGSLRMRNSPVRAEAGTKAVRESRCWRASRKTDQVESPTAARPGDPHNPATTWTGSSVSSQGRRAKASGRGATRGASSAGITRVAGPSAGCTSMVSRSSGMAR